MRLDWITGAFQCLDEQEMRNLYDKENVQRKVKKKKKRGKTEEGARKAKELDVI